MSEELVEKVSEFYEDTGKTTLSALDEHHVDLKAWQIYETDYSWTEILSETGVHWSDKNEYTEEDIYNSVEEFVLNNRVSSTAYHDDSYYPTVYAVRNRTNKTFNQVVGDIFSVDDLDSSVSRCVDCDGIFRNLGHHWRVSDCDYPRISNKQKEIIKGILMGDGCVKENNEDCHSMTIDITRPKFLKWISEEFPVLFNKPRMILTSEDRLEKDTEDSLFGIDENREYRDMYSVNSRVHPYFTHLRKKWYLEDGKVFPEDLELTPDLLKMWYVTDGGLSFKNGKEQAACVRIYTKNENQRLDFLSSLFDDIGIRNYQTEYAINIPEVEDFFGYIGKESVSGFEYKWAIDNYGEYKKLKDDYGCLEDD